MSGTFSLRYLRPPCHGYRLSGSVVTVGRSANCDIILHDPTVSRRHAELRFRGAGLWVEDLESLNGTFVGGDRVSAGPILPGQCVWFGSVAFVVVAADAPDPMAETVLPGPVAEVPAPIWRVAAEILSDAECRIFAELLAGDPEKCIAARLGRSPSTVHHHITRIYSVFGVCSRAELLAMALAGSEDNTTVMPPGNRR